MQSSWVQRVHMRIASAASVLALIAGLVLPAAGTTAQENDLTGDYTVSYINAQIPTDVANGAMLIGRWRLSFTADGSYQSSRLDLGVLVTGTYQVDGDSVTITDESGLLSCSNASAATGGQPDVSTATYTFELDAGNLRFSPVDERCDLRRILFTTSDFSTYIPCATDSLVLSSDTTPAAGETPAPGALEDGPTPEGRERDPSVPKKAVEDQIDELLSQMTACWATGDPARFLPLLSADFQVQILSGNEQENIDALASLQSAMLVPIVWERAGDVTLTGDDRAEAVVRTTAADQEEFVRYFFVLEDGAWRWDGTAAG